MLRRDIANGKVSINTNSEKKRARSAPIALDLALSGSPLDRDPDARYERILGGKYDEKSKKHTNRLGFGAFGFPSRSRS